MVEQGAEAIIITASGCGTQVKDYGRLLSEDPDYADKARRISALCADIVEIFDRVDIDAIRIAPPDQRLVFHAPCSLQHGQRLSGKVEQLLTRLGFSLAPVRDANQCCGSAGTYALLNPDWSHRIRAKKLDSLQASAPETIATANIGCLHHLQAGTSTPVKHWIEIVDQYMTEDRQGNP